MIRSCLVAVAALFGSQASADPDNTPYNVLFVYIDDWGHDLSVDLGQYRTSPLQTPGIDALAAQSVSFPNAYSPFPLCNPSRIATLLGMRPLTTGFTDNNRQLQGSDWNGNPVLPYHFRNHGYTVGGTGKVFHNSYFDPGTWDEIHLRADDPWIKKPRHPMPSAGWKGVYWGTFENGPDGTLGEMRETKQTDAGIDMMSRFPEPWFVAVGYQLPHPPFVYPEPFASLYSESDVAAFPLAEQRGSWKAAVGSMAWRSELFLVKSPVPRGGYPRHALRAEAQVAYWRCVSYVDSEVGRLMSGLQALGLDQRTVVVLVSDHGWSLGHHDRYGKLSLFDWESRGLVVIRAPGMVPGQESSRPVEHIDLYPTLMELCTLPSPPGLEGDSLVPLLKQPTAPFGPAVCFLKRGSDEGRSVRSDRYKFVHWSDDRHALYDLQADPGEYRNLFGDPDHDAIVFDHIQFLQDEGQLDGEAFQFNYGTALNGTLGAPTLTASDPVLGQTMFLDYGNSHPQSAQAYTLQGSAPARDVTPFVGVSLVMNPVWTSLALPAGGMRLPVKLPPNPALDGTEMFLQLVVVDPGAPLGVAFSRGLYLHLGTS